MEENAWGRMESRLAARLQEGKWMLRAERTLSMHGVSGEVSVAMPRMVWTVVEGDVSEKNEPERILMPRQLSQ